MPGPRAPLFVKSCIPDRATFGYLGKMIYARLSDLLVISLDFAFIIMVVVVNMLVTDDDPIKNERKDSAAQAYAILFAVHGGLHLINMFFYSKMYERRFLNKRKVGGPILETIPEHKGDSTCVWCLDAPASDFSPYVCGHNPVCRQCYPHWDRGDLRSCERCNQPRF